MGCNEDGEVFLKRPACNVRCNRSGRFSLTVCNANTGKNVWQLALGKSETRKKVAGRMGQRWFAGLLLRRRLGWGAKAGKNFLAGTGERNFAGSFAF